MNTVIDSNFIIATCAVFTLMLMIFAAFFNFIIMPVINKNTEAINNLGMQLKETINDHKMTLDSHNRRITDTEKNIAVVEQRIEDHLEVS
jgi:HAMP domain-containing protein